MSLCRHHFRPRLERLEGRDTPSNFTVSFSGLTHTLTIVGDSANNSLTVQGDAGDATKFHLSSASDTFNHNPGPFDSPSGVKNITIQMLAGDDSVTFGNTVPIDLKGNLSISGGDGAKSVTATDLKVEKNFSITNGKNTSGTDVNTLLNLTVGGSLTINNGTGDTSTSIYRDSAGISTIGGNLSITNGAGEDHNSIYDTNVGGNVTINNGHGNAQTGLAGYTWFFNVNNTGYRAQIKGNYTVSYLDGNVSSYDGIWDTEVHGNVTFNHGSGSATTNFDGYQTALPVIIRGNLTLTGSGANTVTIGTQYNHTGLILDKNLTITTGAAADTLTFNKLEVDGITRLDQGNGNNTATIDDSVFVGKFTLTTGSGNDQVFLDHTAGTSAPTIFEAPVLISLGAGADFVARDGTADANQEIIALSTFVIHYGGNAGDSTSYNTAQEIFPFGGSIQWIP
jgi:hypothetical protein